MLARGVVILVTIPFFWAVAKYTRTAGQNVVKARTTIELRVYHTNRGFPSRLLTTVGIGVGFSNVLAEQRASEAALQDAIKKLGDGNQAQSPKGRGSGL
jgi:hypothetical protein